jgi:hypothetical protein
MTPGSVHYVGVQTFQNPTITSIHSMSLTVAVPPATPTGLGAAPLNASVLLNWTVSEGAMGYNVWSSNSVSGVVQIDTTNATAFTKTGLDNGTEYFFKVSATNSYGESAYSAAVSATPAAVKADQTITFALGTTVTKTVIDAPFADTATASPSFLPVTYSSTNEAVATVDASGTVTIVGLGTTAILADQAGNESFNPAPQVSQTLTVTKADQTITFTLGTNVTKTLADAPFADTATASSSLTVTYTSTNETVATVAIDGTVTIVGLGTTAILADQSGNGSYNAAPQVSQALTVTKATPVITWANPASITVGTALSGTQLNATSGGVPGSFVYTPSSGTVLTLGSHTLSVQFTPDNLAIYTIPAAKEVTITVTIVVNFTQTALNISSGATGVEIQNSGTLVRAIYYGGGDWGWGSYGPASIVVQGMTFTNGTAGGHVTAATDPCLGGAAFDAGMFAPAGGNHSDFQALVRSLATKAGGGANWIPTLTITNLTVGHQYRLQYIPIMTDSVNVTVEGATLSLAANATGNQMLTAEWTAQDDTLNVVFDHGIGTSGYVLHDLGTGAPRGTLIMIF